MGARKILLLDKQTVVHSVGNLLLIVTHRQRLNALNVTKLTCWVECDVVRIEVVYALLYQIRLTVLVNAWLADECVGLLNLDSVYLNHLADSLLVNLVSVELNQVCTNGIAADVAIDI